MYVLTGPAADAGNPAAEGLLRGDEQLGEDLPAGSEDDVCTETRKSANIPSSTNYPTKTTSFPTDRN